MKELIARIRTFFCALFALNLPLPKAPEMKHHKEEVIEEGGTFTVTGTDVAIFKLPGTHTPKVVEVDFDESCPPLVCNPRHRDELDWEVVEAEPYLAHKFELKVTWHVSGIRRIRWSVRD